MKVKRPSASATTKLKVTRNGRVAALLLLNVAIVLTLTLAHKRLLDASREDTPAARGQISPGAVRRRHLEDAQIPQPPPTRLSITSNSAVSQSVPSISDEEFNEKYAGYRGLLPALKREGPDDACGKRPDFFDFFKATKDGEVCLDVAWFHEDKIIYDLFKNSTLPSSLNEESPLPKGTYVELGAFDGKDEANTMFFDKCLGWDGLLIEAQSKSYEQVIRNRPHAVKLSFSPTCKEERGRRKFYDIPLSNNGMEGLAKSYTGRETVEVPCGPLTPVLHDVFGPEGQISFFSLDVEGAELMVLETLDFNVLSIDVLMIEIQKYVLYMAKTGKYALFAGFLEASDVYIRWGTEAWRRATAIQRERKELLAREMRDHMMKERQQLIG
ncbi:hypothetical protein ACHAXT_009507 [Thalassiosira profunda]